MKKLSIQFFIYLITTLIFFESVAQINIWLPRANFGGSARWGAFGFSIGQYGYIGGGFDGGTLNDLWQYNPLNNSWTKKNVMPFQIRTACSFVINNKAYVVGGIDNSNNIVGKLWEYDPINDTWTSKAVYPGAAIYGAAGFAIGGKGYFGIGNAGSSLGPYKNEFYEYDPVFNSWTQKASFPGPIRYGTFGIAANGLGYVTCGVDENSGSLYNDFWEFNPVANTWLLKGSFPGVPRTYPQGFVINGKIYIGTGQNYTVQFDDFYQYNQANNSWTTEANYGPGKRWLCPGFSINSDGYMGTGTSNNTNASSFWVFTKDTTTIITTNDTCIMLKPNGIKGKDIHIINSMPNSNNDPFPEFLITAWTCNGNLCNDRELIQFDLSSLPTSAIISKALINLYANPNPITIPSANYGNSNSILIQRITTPWNEQTVTWNTKPTTVTTNQVTVPQSISSNQNCLNIDVTNLVKDMILDSANSFGFNFQMVDENTYYNGRDFATSDYPDSSKWPSIEICYKIPNSVVDSTVASDNIDIYPNPFVDNLQVSLTLKNSSNVLILMYNTIGQIVFEKSFFLKADETTVVKISDQNLSQYPAAGVYFLNVITDNKSVIEKLITTN